MELSKTSIAIIGTHGSGKTTLIRKAKQTLEKRIHKTVVFTGEVARQCPYEVGRHSNALAQTWIIRTQDLLESFTCSIGLPVVLDRCLIDQYAYYSYWIGCKMEVENMMTQALSRYREIFMLPPNPQFLEDDGVRPVSVNFQERMAERINRIVDKLKIPIIACEDNEDTTVTQLLQSINKVYECMPEFPSFVDLSLANSGFGQEIIPKFSDDEAVALIEKFVHVESYRSSLRLPLIHLGSHNPSGLRSWFEHVGFKFVD